MHISRIFKQTIYISLIILISSAPVQGEIVPKHFTEEPMRLGAWITVFSEQKVLFSTENSDKLIETCTNCGINDIYLQLYRANKAYYNSDIIDGSSHKKILAESGGKDIIPYLLDKAKNAGIQVHAWINVLSIAKNENAEILEKYGKDILTYDQYGNTSLHITKGFIPEHQIFLEPGDYRVREYSGNIVKEILQKYPGFSGIHMDYIRYPSSLPYIPGARFTNQGLSYGYNRFNLLNFEKATGLDPKTMNFSRENAFLWDDWRRGQVTRLVGYLSRQARSVAPDTIISCAVIPSVDKAYLITFQNWPEWLRKEIADHIVFMNYTDHTGYMKIRSESVLFPDLKDKLQIGLGAYLLKEDIEELKKQILEAKTLSPQGIVLFSYDDIAENEELQVFLNKTFVNNSQEKIQPETNI